MNTRYKIAGISFLVAIMSCSAPGSKHQQSVAEQQVNTGTETANAKAKINITLTPEKSLFQIGETVKISVKSSAASQADSVKLVLDNTILPTMVNSGKDFIEIETRSQMPGNTKLEAEFYFGDTLHQQANCTFRLLSDIVPEKYTYKVVKSWPHNNRFYTQGLEFNNGVLFEGTGQYGESGLFKVESNTGEIIQSLNLDRDVFGEGITIMGDQLFQLTWQSNVGFVYDKNTFKKLHTFNYPTEGWGLTHNSTHLIMSDGSEKIYFLDKDYLQESYRIEVYNNQGPITNLNELELVGNILYANIYGSHTIVAIDVNTGKVLKEFDLTGLPEKNEINGNIDVLNGIAWDEANQRMVITGKWWPKYYQVEWIKKK